MKQTVTNLFGEEVTPEALTKTGKRKTPKRKGYAAQPGTGPEGESCKTCRHRVRVLGKYNKCNLVKAFWTGGFATDVLVKSPACQKWEEVK